VGLALAGSKRAGGRAVHALLEQAERTYLASTRAVGLHMRLLDRCACGGLDTAVLASLLCTCWFAVWW
jgi:hypothetical protein